MTTVFKPFATAVILGTLFLSSCKKDKDDNPSCEKTVAGIANTFKLTKQTAEISLGGGEQDIALTPCNLSGVYVLKADKTCTYVESGSGCNTTEETGTWDVVSNKISISVGPLVFSDLDIFGWDCTNLTVGVAQSASGITTTQRFYFVKQ